MISLCLTVVMAAASMLMAVRFYKYPHNENWAMFHAGIDVMGAFVSAVLFYGCMNQDGHEYPAVCRNGSFELLKDPHGLVLGSIELARYKEYEIQLDRGDMIFVYTDDVPEAARADQTMFGTE